MLLDLYNHESCVYIRRKCSISWAIMESMWLIGWYVYIVDFLQYENYNTQEGQEFHGECYISGKKNWAERDFNNPNVALIGNFTHLSFDWKDNERSVDLNISQRLFSQTDRKSGLKMWQTIQNNGTVYLHVHLTQLGASPNPRHSNYHGLKTLHQATPLIKVSYLAFMKTLADV